jgi:hypothetical protein
MPAITALNVALRAAVLTTFAYSKVRACALPATLHRSDLNNQIFVPPVTLIRQSEEPEADIPAPFNYRK